MKNKHSLVLVIIKEVNLQSGLVALLTAVSSIDTVLVAENYTTGFKLLKNHRPGLIVLDISLEKDTTNNFLIQINNNYPDIKSIILTDIDQPEEKGLKLYADAYISKGFSAEIFLKTLHKLLEDDR